MAESLTPERKMKFKLPARQGLPVENTLKYHHLAPTKQNNNKNLLNFYGISWSHKKVMDYLKIIF